MSDNISDRRDERDMVGKVFQKGKYSVRWLPNVASRVESVPVTGRGRMRILFCS